MPAAKVLGKPKPKVPSVTAMDGLKAASLEEKANELYHKLSLAGREKWSILLDVKKMKAWEKSLRSRVRQQAGKSYFCYVRGMSAEGAATKVLDSIFSGFHAARCIDWEGHVVYGIPAVYAHGEPQRATKQEHIRIMQSLFADGGYRDRLCMDVLTMIWEDQVKEGDVKVRSDGKPTGPSAKEVLAMSKQDGFRILRHSCWMTGIQEGDIVDSRIQSDELRWMIAVSKLRVEMRCGVMRAFDAKALEQTLYIGFEALEHGAKLRQVRRGERLRFEVLQDEYCTPREYAKQSHGLYQSVGFPEGCTELAVMDLYSEFVNSLGVLSAYAVRKAKEKSAGLKYETSRKVPGVEFTGIARVSESEANTGSGMDPEREKLLNELLDERMRLGKAKQKGSGTVKGLTPDDLDRGHSRYEHMESLDE